MKIKLNTKGETIVEVLIGIVLVASVLSGAYTLLHRVYRQNQSSVERIAALKAAESRAELLRKVPSEVLRLKTNNSSFCITNTGTLVDYNSSDTSCKVDRYFIKITKNVSGSSATYLIAAEWDGLISPIEKLTMYYRP